MPVHIFENSDQSEKSSESLYVLPESSGVVESWDSYRDSLLSLLALGSSWAVNVDS
jgi:hypothetical protein